MIYQESRSAVRDAAVVKARPRRRAPEAQSAVVGAWEWNVLSGEYACSATVYEILGRTADRCPPELDGFLAGVHPEDRARVAETVNHAVENHIGFESIYRVIDSEDRVRWIESRADVFKDRGGSTTRFIGTIADVTRREQENEAHRKHERQYRHLIELLPAAVYTTDADGRITHYNQAASDLWGCHPTIGSDQWCGSWRLYWPDGSPMSHDESPMAVALRENRSVTGLEAITERPDGSRVPFMAFPTPLHDQAGVLVGAVNMLVDISDRKVMAEEREIHLAELRALNEQLQRAMAETHHRVKNNLQVIAAIIDMMAGQSSEPIPPQDVRTLSSHVRALAIVHDLLTKAARGDGDTESVSSRDILTQLLQLQEQSSAGHSIVFKIDNVRLPIRAATSLALVTNELVQNAIKYGRRAISVTLAAKSGQARLTVTDDGPGFPVDFDPERLETTGLELVRSLTKWDLGGSIEFSSAEKTVAEVTVRFPLPFRAR